MVGCFYGTLEHYLNKQRKMSNLVSIYADQRGYNIKCFIKVRLNFYDAKYKKM